MPFHVSTQYNNRICSQWILLHTIPSAFLCVHGCSPVFHCIEVQPFTTGLYLPVCRSMFSCCPVRVFQLSVSLCVFVKLLFLYSRTFPLLPVHFNSINGVDFSIAREFYSLHYWFSHPVQGILENFSTWRASSFDSALLFLWKSFSADLLDG